jgi:putative peptidoglycan lipid II flippase
VIGMLFGEVLLRRRFGALGTERVIRTTTRLAVLSTFGGLAAWGVLALVTARLGGGVLGSGVAVLLGSIAGLLALAAIASQWHLEELRELLGSLRGRGSPSAPPGLAGAAAGSRRRSSGGGRHRAR